MIYTYKKCNNCNIEKSIIEFSKRQRTCKICQKDYRKKNKEKIAAYNKKYHEENKNKRHEQTKKNRKNNIEKFLLRNAKNRAIKKNIFFCLTEEDVKNKRPKNDICPLLEIKMEINNKIKQDNSISIDRIDSSKGYNKDNIWLICNKANSSKNNATVEEYEMIVKNLEKLKIKKSYNSKTIEANLQYAIDDAKKRAKKKDLDFNLDKEYLKLIYPADNICPLLKINLKKGHKRPSKSSPALDRIEPNKGYIKDNVAWISYRANTIKNNLTLEEMKLLLKNWKKQLNNKE